MKCHCDSGQTFEACCKPFLNGAAVADSPLKLMRSRYCAFVEKKFQYLEDTTDSQALGEVDHAGNAQWAQSVNFDRLEILNSSMDGNKGRVEFKAFYIIVADPEKKLQMHHEVSQFRKKGDKWYFRSGKSVQT